MKNIKNSNLLKLVAFFILTVVLTCTVAYAAQDLKSPTVNDPDDNGKTEDETPSGDTDENTDGKNEEIPVVKPVPEFLHYLTGLEITAEAQYVTPLCFVLSSDTPVYGLSDSYLVVELPCEDGKTRYCAFFDEPFDIGKLGSIAPTRPYISNVASYFGAIEIAKGVDSIKQYNSFPPLYGTVNLERNTGYHYTEYSDFVYTNGDLLGALVRNTKADFIRTELPEAPFAFADYYTPLCLDGESCVSIKIPYSASSSTELIYSDTDKQYTLSKNGNVEIDPINDNSCKYENVFILFADSTTYETSEYTECVLNTDTSGKGKYATMGKYVDITWSVDSSGKLTLLDADGNTLTVNRGKSYISFAKSSATSSVTIK